MKIKQLIFFQLCKIGHNIIIDFIEMQRNIWKCTYLFLAHAVTECAEAICIVHKQMVVM